MAGSDVSTLHVVHSLILTTYEMGAVYSPFTDKLTEVQTDELTCLRSCNLNPASSSFSCSQERKMEMNPHSRSHVSNGHVVRPIDAIDFWSI